MLWNICLCLRWQRWAEPEADRNCGHNNPSCVCIYANNAWAFREEFVGKLASRSPNSMFLSLICWGKGGGCHQFHPHAALWMVVISDYNFHVFNYWDALIQSDTNELKAQWILICAFLKTGFRNRAWNLVHSEISRSWLSVSLGPVLTKTVYGFLVNHMKIWGFGGIPL